MSFFRKLLRLLKALFGESTTAQQSSSQKHVYKTITVIDEGVPVAEGGRRYYLDAEVINFMLVQETDLTVKSEIRTLIKEKEADGINAYSFESKFGRYEIVNGTFKRYPKTN